MQCIPADHRETIAADTCSSLSYCEKLLLLCCDFQLSAVSYNNIKIKTQSTSKCTLCCGLSMQTHSKSLEWIY